MMSKWPSWTRQRVISPENSRFLKSFGRKSAGFASLTLRMQATSALDDENECLWHSNMFIINSEH